MAVGGPIESIVLGGRRFSVNSEDAANVSLDGFSNEVKENGDGGRRLVKSRVPAMIENLNVEIDTGLDALEYLQDLRDGLAFFDVVLTYCDGTVYAGAMQLTGDVKNDAQQTTAGITLTGSLAKL
jgi:hypothetical protein